MNATLLALILAAGPVKLAVMPLDASEGVTEKTAAALTESVVSQIRRRADLSVVTPSEMASVLSLERQKQLLGCNDESCASDLGNVLGVDRMVIGTVAQVGTSWLFHLKLVDVRRVVVVAQADRRLKDKTIDDVLDELPAAVTELFGGPSGTVVPAGATQVMIDAPAKLAQSAGVDEPFDLPAADRKTYSVFADGKGAFIAMKPFQSDAPMFAGDGKMLWEQRLVGGRSESEKSFSYTFWDPRARDGWQRSWDLLESGGYVLQCGDKKIAYQKLSPAEAQKVLGKARLHKVRWRRAAHTLARDDGGNYFLLDQLRDVEDPSEGLRFFFGPKGKVREFEIKSALADGEGVLVITPTGRLKISPNQKAAEWITTAGVIKLTYVEINPAEAKLIYSTLGAYQGERLGTPCDPYL